jgi:hypothetical protein
MGMHSDMKRMDLAGIGDEFGHEESELEQVYGVENEAR